MDSKKKPANSPLPNQAGMLRRNLIEVNRWAMEVYEENERLKNISTIETSKPKRKVKTIIAAPHAATKSRGRAAVIAWDMAHNPVGRAMVIYDLLKRDYEVELIGPLWSRYGTETWEPILHSDRKIRGFRVETLSDYYPAALAFAESEKYDLVVACKPRLPSLLLGAMIKRHSKCPLLIDVDDFELSFFKNDNTAELDELIKAGPEALIEPYEELPTRVCNGFIQHCDAVLVSNVVLRNKFGGYIVRHARDEYIFSSEHYDRKKARKAIGIKPDEFALVFVGTARPHKGIYTVASTLDKMADDRFVLHIVGDINNKTIENKLKSYKNARIIIHPSCDFTELPHYIVAADAVPLLQDPKHVISQYQIPAKISDAAAFGQPILTTDVPPLADLKHMGVVKVIDPKTLRAELLSLISRKEDGSITKMSANIRAGFDAEFGFNVNRERLYHAINTASKAPAELSNPLKELLQHVKNTYITLEKEKKKSEPKTRLKSGKDQQDLVMFWKQNDTGLYGRRSDMVMKQLIKTGSVNLILQFDASMEIRALARLAEESSGPNSHQALVLKHTVNNQLGLSDQRRCSHRTFIHSKEHNNKSILTSGKNIEAYPAWVKKQMKAEKIHPKNTIAWVYPVVMDFPEITKAIPFKMVVSDIVDDQRTFKTQPSMRKKIETSYEATLPLSDIVLTNCESIVDAFSPIAGKIHIVPNGTEAPQKDLVEPDFLKNIKRPIVGYVGNLRDRVDWDLLDETAARLPNMNFVIIGGGEREVDVEKIKTRNNVIFLGVVPYKDVQACMASFDVALVPHLSTELTKRMNPLKVYNYFASGKPIVSTEIANVDLELRQFIKFANDPDGFAAAIRDSIETPLIIDAAYKKALSKIMWKNRIKIITEIMLKIA
ncbi:MAG: glycosyltransferase [Maricaulaceae bacterium]